MKLTITLGLPKYNSFKKLEQTLSNTIVMAEIQIIHAKWKIRAAERNFRRYVLVPIMCTCKGYSVHRYLINATLSKPMNKHRRTLKSFTSFFIFWIFNMKTIASKGKINLFDAHICEMEWVNPVTSKWRDHLFHQPNQDTLGIDDRSKRDCPRQSGPRTMLPLRRTICKCLWLNELYSQVDFVLQKTYLNYSKL